MWHWNDFFWLIVTSSTEMRTMPLGLAVFTQGEAGTEWHLLMAATIFTALPIIILFLIAQKQFIQGIANSGLRVKQDRETKRRAQQLERGVCD